MAHQAGAYPGFYSMKLLPLDGILVHHRVTPSIKFAGTHLYTWVERGTVREEYARPGLKPGPLAPELIALVMRPPHFPLGESGMGRGWENMSFFTT